MALSKEFSSKIFEFIYRKIDIKDFEQWIYNSDQLINELDCDEYLNLIGFNFNSKDGCYSLDKILYELLDKYMVEPQHEIPNINTDIKVSEEVYGMLLGGKGMYTIRKREEIEKVFEDEGIPVFHKVIDFQEQFGGIWYRIGKEFYEGFRMDILYYDEIEKKYKLNSYKTINDKYYFNCMNYHYAGDFGPFIDEDGKIYGFGMGKFLICADNIEEFLEDEAIKYYFVNKHCTWLSRGGEKTKVDEFKEKKDLNKIVKKSFSDKYFEWWCNTEETIFIRIDLMSKFECTYADVYCKDQKILEDLYNSKVGAHKYPYE